MASLHIPSREQHLLELYARDFILTFEYESLLRGVSFEKESFNFNLALSRMSMRFADMVRQDALFPRLKGVYNKLLVENAWEWSKTQAAFNRLKEEGITATVVNGAALRLTSLQGMPRKMVRQELVLHPSDIAKAASVIASGEYGPVCLKDSLFAVRTTAESIPDASEARDGIPCLELQFLLLCAGTVAPLAANVFDDACLQSVMDAVDIVRGHPELRWDVVAGYAGKYGQTPFLKIAMEALKEALPSIFSNINIPYSEYTETEARALRRHELFLDADKTCRENAGKSLVKRAVLRFRYNLLDIARHYPRKSWGSVLALSPAYHYRKYFSGHVCCR
ncbi:MAG: hypothetical protein ACI399_05175 [Candidatus Cryptobacteroides sp.]